MSVHRRGSWMWMWRGNVCECEVEVELVLSFNVCWLRKEEEV